MTGGRRTDWTDPAWRATVVAWAAERLAALGRSITGPVEQPHLRPWSTVLRLPTEMGPVWCKATGPGTAHEARLLEHLAAVTAPLVLAPLAANAERGWILLPDGGPTLRQARPDGTGDHDLVAWDRILAAYAGLQRSLEPDPGGLLATGLPDLRPAAIPGVLAALLDDEAIWDPARVGEADRATAAAARTRLRALIPWVSDTSTRLAASDIAPTLQHDDLHGGNIFLTPAGPRVFDWGDASLAHPFLTLTSTLNSIAYRTGLATDGSELGRVRDAYLAAWTDRQPIAELRRSADLALDLGRISRAGAWARAQEGVPVDALEGDGGAPAMWLADLVERLEGRGIA